VNKEGVREKSKGGLIAAVAGQWQWPELDKEGAVLWVCEQLTINNKHEHFPGSFFYC